MKKPNHIIACIGASSVQGIGDDEGLGGWAGRLQQRLVNYNDRIDYRVFNLGVSGDHLKDIYHRLMTEVPHRRVKTLIINSGVNDNARRLPNIEAAEHYADYPTDTSIEDRLVTWRKLIRFAKANVSNILVTGVTPLDDDRCAFEVDKNLAGYGAFMYRDNESASYNGLIKDIATKASLPFLDLYAACEQVDWRTKMLADGVHPNAAGYEFLTECVYTELLRLNILT